MEWKYMWYKSYKDFINLTHIDLTGKKIVTKGEIIDHIMVWTFQFGKFFIKLKKEETFAKIREK